MGSRIIISESEWEVMKVIWRDPPKTLPEILYGMKGTGWSTTTIQTYLARLVKKGALTTERQGKGYLYYPAISEQNYRLAESRNFLSRLYDGSLTQMVKGFVNGGGLSEEELAELKKLIADQESKNADNG